MDVTVLDMMEARDRRAARQRALLSEYGRTLLCFTMNIPGPVKLDEAVEQGFRIGQRALRRACLRLGVSPLHQEERVAFTGCEAFLVLPMAPEEAKRMAAEIEEADALGRLFDMDVLAPDGTKVDRQEIGLPGRRCLLCGEPAQVCARSRAHTVQALREATGRILREAVRREVARTAASLCGRALLYEVNTTPKPGLVDRENSGSHRDMDIFTFAASTAALLPYFARCAEIGFDTAARPAEETFLAIRPEGRLAEGVMLEATGGVNTHKGAIFSLGILSAAAGRVGRVGAVPAKRLLDEARRMCAGLSGRDFAGLTEENAKTAGQRLYLRYGLTGVRGEAERGFPLAETGLSVLRAGLDAGLSVNDAGCAALLSILAEGTDTNAVHRSSLARAREVSAEADAIRRAEPFPSRERLAAFDRELTRENISPGGSADLLAITYFLYFLEEEKS